MRPLDYKTTHITTTPWRPTTPWRLLNENQSVILLIVPIKPSRIVSLSTQLVILIKITKRKYNPLPIVPCGIFETQTVLFLFVKGGFLYVIKLGRKQHKSGSFILRVNLSSIPYKIYKQISPVVHFLPVTFVHKQETLSIYFKILQNRQNILPQNIMT